MKTSTEEIAAGNLVFLATLLKSAKHKIVLSEQVGDMSQNDPENFQELITKIRLFNSWTNDNDPYEEKDFGRVGLSGTDYFFKIDLYDPSWEWGFDRETMTHDKCRRLLTIMRASEY